MSQNVTQTELVNSITNHAYKDIFRWKKRNIFRLSKNNYFRTRYKPVRIYSDGQVHPNQFRSICDHACKETFRQN